MEVVGDEGMKKGLAMSCEQISSGEINAAALRGEPVSGRAAHDAAGALRHLGAGEVR